MIQTHLLMILLSAAIPSLILHLHFFYIAGVGGVNFTIANNCSQTIWAMVSGTPTVNRTSASSGDEVRAGSSIAIQLPNRWNGRIWGKTGCIFNESGNASCATGDDSPFTLAEIALNATQSSDFYDVSLVDGYNLPLLIKPDGGCNSSGCINDLNQRCPPELRTAGGAACKGPCSMFLTVGDCIRTTYSELFKQVCPQAYSFPLDDVNSTFSCAAASRYTITFCPFYNSSLVHEGMQPAPSPASSYPPPRKGSDHPGKNSAGELVTIVSLSISGVIVVFISICCFLRRRRSGNGTARKCDRDFENLLLQHGSLAPKRYRYSELKKITKSWSDKLGRGGYGSVYKGMLPNGSPVAVKILTETDSNGEEFINEVASISKTSHVNIVTLLGFCYEGNKRALVYEFMPNSSLDKFLNNNESDFCLDSDKLYKIAVGIAKGLEYLHTGCITRIVHFDIKPQNILLDEELCPKISDFGLAKLCKKKQSVLSVAGMRGTVGYIAPEVFSRNFGGVSHKSDVYSYGMMLLEMAGAKKETQAEVIQSSESYIPDIIYEQVILMDVTSNDDLMKEERKKLFLVGFWCIQTNPSDRPTISKVVEMLEGSVEAIQIPPKPFLFTPPLIPDQHASSTFSDNIQTQNSDTV